jgi:uncharacterized protein YyaL (SSP411 family)
MNRLQPKSKVWISFLMLLLFACPSQAIVWHAWSDEIFAQAAREHKFVLLDLEAVWCHCRHVMDEQTYRDSAVRRLM